MLNELQKKKKKMNSHIFNPFSMFLNLNKTYEIKHLTILMHFKFRLSYLLTIHCL